MVEASDQRWEDELNTMQAYVLVQTESRNSGIAKDLEAVAGGHPRRGPERTIRRDRAGPLRLERTFLRRVVAQLREVPTVARTIVAPLLGSFT